MKNIEDMYLQSVDRIMKDGIKMQNRTGIATKKIAFIHIEHDFKYGYPILTTKKVPFKVMATELEGFIKGITDKKWFQDRGCHIWDDWCNPQKVPYGTDNETKLKMKNEMDLGYIYGSQWRNFNGSGYDQLKTIIDKAKKDPTDRRLVVSAWNPQQLNMMALPPCHLMFEVVIAGNLLSLGWFQRSCDMMLGVPFNIASYALLEILIAKELNLTPHTLSGTLGDAHIYENHFAGAEIQLLRKPKTLPTIEIDNWTSIYDWKAEDCRLIGYNPDNVINFPIAV